MKITEKLIKDYKEITDWDKFTELIKMLTSIDESRIDDELLYIASLYTYYSGLLAKTKSDLSRAENEAVKYASKLKMEIRDRGLRITAVYAEAEVGSDEQYNKLLINIIVKKERMELMKSLVAGLDKKHDDLIQISANNRAESKIYSK